MISLPWFISTDLTSNIGDAHDTSDWHFPWEGGCRCGQVHMRISAPPILTMACHCKGRQRMSSSAFSLGVAIPSEGFAVIKGEPVIGGLHGANRHYFSPHCMSWVLPERRVSRISSTCVRRCSTTHHGVRRLSRHARTKGCHGPLPVRCIASRLFHRLQSGRRSWW